jgi:hypothetical protein
MKALESMRPGTRQPAGNGQTSHSTAKERAIAPPTPDRTTRASRGNPRGADPKDSQEPRRREIRDHLFAFIPQGKIHAEEVEPEQVPAPTPGVTQDEPQGKPEGSWNPPPRSLRFRAEAGSHPPARAGRTEPGKEGTPACGARVTRARSMTSLKTDDERSGVATPGVPASAGTSKVRRTGGLRGPHAIASEPASEGRARRQLQARTEDSGGAARSTTTRTEDRETGSSE